MCVQNGDSAWALMRHGWRRVTVASDAKQKRNDVSTSAPAPPSSTLRAELTMAASMGERAALQRGEKETAYSVTWCDDAGQNLSRTYWPGQGTLLADTPETRRKIEEAGRGV